MAYIVDRDLQVKIKVPTNQGCLKFKLCASRGRRGELGVMVFNITFNNISVLLLLSVLLVEETTHLPQVIDQLYHIVVWSRPFREWDSDTTLVVVA